ncbi:MAG: ion transporter [Acutalibacteraceae bacterium]
MYRKIKQRIFEIIEVSKDGDKASKIFDICIMALIIINSVLVIAYTFDIPLWLRKYFVYIEIFSVIIFTIEYLLRIYTADLLYPELSPVKSRLRYIFSFMAIIDLLTILPFYIPLIIPIDLRVLRMIRIVRLLRIFKIHRYTSALSTILQVFKNKRHQLVSSIVVVFILMIIASVLMYNIENEAQPDVFDNVFSALWWAVATFTTVGYGDIYPVTVSGKILGSIIALLGIGLIAVPTGIISAGFMENIDKNKDNDNEDDEKCYCPYCGKKIK